MTCFPQQALTGSKSPPDSSAFAQQPGRLPSDQSPDGTPETDAVVAHWNDDLFFDSKINSLFKRKVIATDDDNLTANFWVRVGTTEQSERNYVDAYLNIITSKANNYRTDLLSLRALHEDATQNVSWHYGAGIVFSGDFGGRSIQNGYHSFAGFSKISLPYAREKYFGVSFYGSIKPVWWKYYGFTFTSPLSASFLTGGGPSSVEGGFSLLYEFNGWTNLQIRAHTGYVDYYQNNSLLAPFFGRGILRAIMMSDKITKDFNVSVWVAENQYGRRYQHYGFALSTSFIATIDDVRFP
ncbi:MAG: hypothetical protein KGJ59_12140 [Bacteroidota bacterium]|nr:hypothetical protein [Bacteroidota bacterium]